LEEMSKCPRKLEGRVGGGTNHHCCRGCCEQGLCQLFLDTPSYNAHVTGTDALWVGIPLLTLPAEKVI
jgi:hypothetical protein